MTRMLCEMLARSVAAIIVAVITQQVWVHAGARGKEYGIRTFVPLLWASLLCLLLYGIKPKSVVHVYFHIFLFSSIAVSLTKSFIGMIARVIGRRKWP